MRRNQSTWHLGVQKKDYRRTTGPRRAYAWLDTGTHASLLDAGNFVRTLTERQGQQVGSPDEVAFEMGWINAAQMQSRAQKFGKNNYGDYLLSLTKI